MGSSCGCFAKIDVERPTKWKTYLTGAEALNKYSMDGSVPVDCSKSMLELRMFLDDTDLTKTLRLFAKSKNIVFIEHFAFWTEILEFKMISPECFEYKRAKACGIFNRYVKSHAEGELHEVVSVIRSVIAKESETDSDFEGLMDDSIFDPFLHHVLEILHTRVFLSFKETSKYSDVVNQIKRNYRVGVNDFEYLRRLGQGGYGVVVHVRKKSTGVHYAMKIQAKESLLKTFKKSPIRVLDEKNSLIACVHPFIIGLEYSFQTPSAAIMVMELSTVGTLHDQRKLCQNEKMGLDRVLFYASEVCLALSHIHRLGLIFRDLKPTNILFCNNGHIKVVDLGGIIDPRGHLSSKNVGDHSTLRFFATSGRTALSLRADLSGRSNDTTHKLSVMGTKGYMAPEMRRDGDAGHYSKAIDWWTLGVTMFELLYGRKPFVVEVVDDEGYHIPSSYGHGSFDGEDNSASSTGFVRMASIGIAANAPHPSMQSSSAPTSMKSSIKSTKNFFTNFLNHNKIINPLDFLIYFKQDDGTEVSPETMDLLSRLMIVEPKRRLGAGSSGFNDIKRHAIFKDTQWDMLEQLQVEPPYLPYIPPLPQTARYASFEDMSSRLCKDKTFNEVPTDHNQLYFKKWNYISSSAVKEEISKESSSNLNVESNKEGND